jgi:hypothetical protein
MEKAKSMGNEALTNTNTREAKTSHIKTNLLEHLKKSILCATKI